MTKKRHQKFWGDENRKFLLGKMGSKTGEKCTIASGDGRPWTSILDHLQQS